MSGTGSDPDALRRAVPLLRCPVCAAPVGAFGAFGAFGALGALGAFGAEQRASPPGPVDPACAAIPASPASPISWAPINGVRCAAGHSFDRARQGQLTLFGPRGRRFPGDSTEQVAARERVLGSGAYDPVADLLAEIARDAVDHAARPGAADGPVVLEAGAGTGFYLARVVEELRSALDATALDHASDAAAIPLGIGTEISVAAARRLAKSSPDVAALVADTWDGLPVADESVDLLQVVFAPRNATEFARVLVPGGTLVVAGPGPGHLEPLRSDAGMLTPESDKAERLEAGLAGFFTPDEVHVVDTTVTVPRGIAVDLALMGPSGVHLDRAELEHSLGRREHEVRIHVEARTFRVAK